MGVVPGAEHPAFPPGPSPVATWADLVEVLRHQHDELGTSLTRLPELEGAAREDVFLQVRRRLAVHEALEQLVLAPRLGPDLRDDLLSFSEEVAAVELADPASEELRAADAQLVAAHRHHAHVQEREAFVSPTGVLPADEQAVVTLAMRLWEGEGDAYLGNWYAEMLASAREQLTRTLH